MNVYQFIDNMIERLNNITVKGADNCCAILQTISDLQQIKQIVVVNEEEEV